MPMSVTTTDHDEIRHWAEARGGRPVMVDMPGEGGILRLDFGDAEDGPTDIGWDAFFAIFDARGMKFLYQDSAGSRFNRVISG